MGARATSTGDARLMTSHARGSGGDHRANASVICPQRESCGERESTVIIAYNARAAAGLATVRNNPSMVSMIGIAAVVYASTNIDDLLLVALFFADPRMRVSAIVVGRLIGTAVLVTVSAASALLALVVPPHWIALLGLVPLGLGLRLLPALVRGRRGENDDGRAEDPSEEDELADRLTKTAAGGFGTQALTVAGVTLANGGDNLGVYIPLFAASPAAIASYAAGFAAMALAWCALGYAVVNNPLIGNRIRRYGHVLLPIVLIALGVVILSGAAPLLR